LEAGTLPVYFGAPNGLQHFPNRSVIFANGFLSADRLGEFLQASPIIFNV